jgi:4-azaleucine resistance transporter AzlC
MKSARNEFLSGIKAQLPILIGVIPFGMIYGVLALEAGLSIGVAQSMSFIVFAGSSQIVATQLFGASVNGLVIILTLSVINLRHMLYSASIAPYIKSLRPFWKWILAYLLTDEAYALSITHYRTAESHNELDTEHQHWFFLGTGLALWISWQLSTAAGIFLGMVIPATWPLDFTIALTFIALLIPTIDNRAGVAAALVAGILALVTLHFPLKLGLVISALIGIAAGVIVDLRS